MTRTKLKKVIVVEKIISGHMTNTEGAKTLGLTGRQVISVKKEGERRRSLMAIGAGNLHMDMVHTSSRSQNPPPPFLSHDG